MTSTQNTLKSIDIGFQLIEAILKFCREFHLADPWFCFDAVGPFIEKMVLERLPSLQADIINSTELGSIIEMSRILCQCALVTVELSGVSLFTAHCQVLVKPILLNLQSHLQAMMESASNTKDMNYSYTVISLTYSLHRSLITAQYQSFPFDIKGSLSKLNEWVWQCVGVLAERVIEYHVQLCQLSLMHCNTLYQGKHVSFSVQMWHFYIQCLKKDLFHSLPAQLAVDILIRFLESTLRTLTHHYCTVIPSEDTLAQYQADVISILLTVAAIKPMLLLYDTAGRGVEAIDQLCCTLLYSLTIIASPLSVAQELIEKRRDDIKQYCHWQSCLPLDEFNLSVLYQENVKDVIIYCSSPDNTHHSLLVKCLLISEFRVSLVKLRPQLFHDISNVLVYCGNDCLKQFFTECQISIHHQNQLTTVALSWLRDHMMPLLLRAVTKAAFDYTKASLKDNEREALLAVTEFFEALPRLIEEEIEPSVMLVFHHLTAPTQSEETLSLTEFTNTQLLFGELFKGILHMSYTDTAPALEYSLVHQIFSHWNTFASIIHHFFPSSSTAAVGGGSTVAPAIVSKLDHSLIMKHVTRLHCLIQESSTVTNQAVHMTNDLLSITSDYICNHSHDGKDSLLRLDQWIKSNKDRVLSAHSAIEQFDAVKSCTHLNDRKFVDVFNVQLNWTNAVATIASVSSGCGLYRRVLQRWEMSCSELEPEDIQRVTAIKALLLTSS